MPDAPHTTPCKSCGGPTDVNDPEPFLCGDCMSVVEGGGIDDDEVLSILQAPVNPVLNSRVSETEIVTDLWTVFGTTDKPEPDDVTYHGGCNVPRNEISREGIKNVQVEAFGDTTPPNAFLSVTAMNVVSAARVWHIVRVLTSPVMLNDWFRYARDGKTTDTLAQSYRDSRWRQTKDRRIAEAAARGETYTPPLTNSMPSPDELNWARSTLDVDDDVVPWYLRGMRRTWPT